MTEVGSPFLFVTEKTMKQILSKILITLLIAVVPHLSAAQCMSNNVQGRDFWLMFLCNLDNAGAPSLVLSGPPGTHVTVENPECVSQGMGAGWGFNLGENGWNKLDLTPPACFKGDWHGTVEGRGIHVTANADISLYALNFAPFSYDATMILPTSVLDTAYIVQNHPNYLPSEAGSLDGGAEVGFVAVEDGTELTMMLVADIYNNNGNVAADSGSVYTVSLDQGQTCQMVCGLGKSFSGMRVTSNGKPFAMFQGTNCTQVPNDYCGACDHLYEQTLPLKFWGKRFVVVPTVQHVGGDVVLITSSADSCVVSLNGTTMATLGAGATMQLDIVGSAKVINTSQPAMVGLYMKGQECAGGVGDPAAVMIPPVEQGIQQVRFNALGTSNTQYHYVNLVARSVDTADMRLDGTSLDTTWHALPQGYSWLQLPVAPGTHVLSNEHGRFVAFFYGLGYFESYAYIAGMATHNLNNRLMVDGVDVLDYLDSIDICGSDTLRFELVPEDSTTAVEWLVDGVLQADSGYTIARSFPTGSWHRVDAAMPAICDTLTAFIHSHYFFTDTTVAEICIGGSYIFDTLTADSTGVYDMVYPDRYGCDSTRTLLLTVVDTTYSETFDTICFDGSYTWRGRNYTEGGHYTDTVVSPGGNCRTPYGLRLTQLQKPVDGIDSVSFCADGIYRLSVHPSGESAPLPYNWHWSASPHDTLLDGHEGDGSVTVKPASYTLYTLAVDYRCPYSEHLGLVPLKDVQAAMTVRPERMSDGMPWFDATDVSDGVESRTWLVDGVPVGTDYTLHYEVDAATDSVRLVLEVYSHGCRDTASRRIKVVHDGLWVPTVFAPRDPDNGRFVVLASRDVELVELTIYNRQGLRVFQTSEPDNGWDGGTCPQGTYAWHLTYRSPLFPDVLQSRSGTVTLLR